MALTGQQGGSVGTAPAQMETYHDQRLMKGAVLSCEMMATLSLSVN